MEKGTQSVNPRAKIQLIALDLDGTVLNTQKHITKRTLDAIRAAIAQGRYRDSRNRALAKRSHAGVFGY